ncbi:MAG: helix-turn-helix transcriptional regulator [Micromonosporaceae bacterium]|nr:helix-turn-helix transcriptional regulator [Micromonosporaceae bacterium]
MAVIQALAERPSTWRYGYELCQELDLKPGTMYPILIRLADRGLLETSWDTATAAGRPPRHLYRLTGSGRALATALAAEPASAPASTTRRRPGPTARWQGA